jgi:hypothetical protein
MKRAIFPIIILLVVFSAASAQTRLTATGTVFHDLNANGIRDNGEPGIADVAVSNGNDVVLTGQKGNYTLDISDDAIIFVIKPGNYNYLVNGNNLPQFYYIHKPKGSPELDYRGVDPTGPLPTSVDFGLVTGSESDEFSVLVFSDPQTYTEEQIRYYDKGIVEELVGVQNHAFGMTLGDIVGDHLDFYEPINQATSRIGLPWFHVFGNHDMNFDAGIQQHADETFERVFGPATYAFNHGKVHFIILDDVIYPNEITDYSYVGGLREEHFRFIENSLRFVPEENLVVLAMHIPLFNEAPWGETFLNSHRERLFDLLQNHPFTLSLSGHTHIQRHYFFDEEHGWKNDTPHHHYNVGTTSGDWWSGEYRENGIPDATMRDGTPQGYNILHFKGNSYAYDYKVVAQAEDYKMRIYGPKKVPRNQRFFKGEVYVNFFQGSEKDTVQYRVNDGEWRTMPYFIEQDPHISTMRYTWDHAETLPKGSRPSNPVNCYHLWKARVPTNVPAGTNTIHIRVKDKLGRIFEDSWKYEAVEEE